MGEEMIISGYARRCWKAIFDYIYIYIYIYSSTQKSKVRVKILMNLIASVTFRRCAGTVPANY